MYFIVGLFDFSLLYFSLPITIFPFYFQINWICNIRTGLHEGHNKFRKRNVNWTSAEAHEGHDQFRKISMNWFSAWAHEGQTSNNNFIYIVTSREVKTTGSLKLTICICIFFLVSLWLSLYVGVYLTMSVPLCFFFYMSDSVIESPRFQFLHSHVLLNSLDPYFCGSVVVVFDRCGCCCCCWC